MQLSGSPTLCNGAQAMGQVRCIIRISPLDATYDIILGLDLGLELELGLGLGLGYAPYLTYLTLCMSVCAHRYIHCIVLATGFLQFLAPCSIHTICAHTRGRKQL